MSLFNLNVEKSKNSLLLRNEINDKLNKEFGIDFSISFNDLYSVKGGVVRRLKGYISSRDLYEKGYNENDKKFNELFDKVKNFIDKLEFEGFKIEFNKIKDLGWWEYKDWRNRNIFEGNFEEYKKYKIEKERCIILKIKWSV
jgi:hypothetical protein